jgi:hypothetical protein
MGFLTNFLQKGVAGLLTSSPKHVNVGSELTKLHVEWAEFEGLHASTPRSTSGGSQ